MKTTENNIDPFDPAFRRTYIGGTDASALCGLSKWRTAYDVYLEKTDQQPPAKEFDADTNELFIWGHLLEPVICDEWMRRNPQWEYKSKNRLVDDMEYDFIKVNLDREIVHKETGEIRMLEAKTVASTAFKTWQLGVPLDYYSQVQYGLGVTGYDKAIFVILVMDSRQLHDFDVDRDDAYINEMRGEVVDFWTNHVEKMVPCPLTVIDFAGIRSNGKVIEGDKKMLKLYEEVVELKNKAKTDKALLDSKTDEVKMFLGENEILKVGDELLFTWKANDVTRVETKVLKEEYPEVYKKVSKTGIERKLLVK